MRNPLLSICIPTYNRADLLKYTLESIVVQKIFIESYEIEVFISDNCSTDNTEDIVFSFMEQHPSKIKYIKQELNIGFGKNCEFILSNSNGSYRKLHGDSFLFNDGSIAKMINLIETYKYSKPVLFFLNGTHAYTSYVTECTSLNSFIEQVSYQSTWIGGIGFWDDDLQEIPDFNTLAYELPQTDFLFKVLSRKKYSVIYNENIFSGQAYNKKGEYNIAEVFGKSYVAILNKYFQFSAISNKCYNAEKYKLLKNHILPFYFSEKFNFLKTGFLEFMQDYASDEYFYLLTLNAIYGADYHKKFSNILDIKRELWNYFNKHNQTRLISNADITKLTVGNNTYGDLNIYWWGNPDEGLAIGNFVSIGGNVKFMLGGNHQHNCFSTYPFKVKFLGEKVEALTKGKIVVKDDVWIGNDVTIMSGVTIGQGAVIGACSVVTKDVPSYAIVAGNPAMIVKYRFNDGIISKLLEVDFSKIKQEFVVGNADLLYDKITEHNVDEIVKKIYLSSVIDAKVHIFLKSGNSKFVTSASLTKSLIAGTNDYIFEFTTDFDVTEIKVSIPTKPMIFQIHNMYAEVGNSEKAISVSQHGMDDVGEEFIFSPDTILVAGKQKIKLSAEMEIRQDYVDVIRNIKPEFVKNSIAAIEYTIWIVSPDGYIHSRALDEVALVLQGGFRRLNIEVPIVFEHQKIHGKPIVLGCNLLPKMQGLDCNSILLKDSIMFNLEVIQDDSTWLTSYYIELLKNYTVWDYSEQNIRNLQALSVSAQYCGIGYEPELSRISQLPEEQKDIDVLFYGSMNERRKEIIDKLSSCGLRVVTLFGVYGEERDNHISRSKIILNIHYYESKVFEIVRMSYLLANSCFVISERGYDKSLEEPFEEGIAFSEYEKLVDTCLNCLGDSKFRKNVSEAGFRIMSSKLQSDYLKDLI